MSPCGIDLSGRHVGTLSIEGEIASVKALVVRISVAFAHAVATLFRDDTLLAFPD